MNTDIFKSYDIRGKVGTDLTADVCTRVARAFADWLPNQDAVAVGYDMRPDSREFAQAIIAGLTQQGRDVWDIGQVTSDMIYFAVGSNQLAGGVMITASHNPGAYNGIKLCRDQAQAVGLGSGLEIIRDKVVENQFESLQNVGRATKHDVLDGWIKHVIGFIDPNELKPLKLGVDAGNGMAGATFPELEKQVPWRVDRLYFELDGTFPNHEANPLKFETLGDLIELIKNKGLDGGIAFDGDGDRALLVDEIGQVITGGVMSAMISEYFLQKYPGANIVCDIRNSRTVWDIIGENGGKAVISKVGHSNIKQDMRKYDAPFGGEASGHFYFRDNWYADSGMIGAVIGLYVASKSGLKLSELRKKYTHYAAIPETNFEVVDKDRVLDEIKRQFEGHKVNEMDGVTVELDNHAWFNVRPSNTEPLLRLNAEALTQDGLKALVDKVKAIITSA